MRKQEIRNKKEAKDTAKEGRVRKGEQKRREDLVMKIMKGREQEKIG